MKLNEVKEVIENNKESRERNVLEVRNYYNALMFLNKEATEGLIWQSTAGDTASVSKFPQAMQHGQKSIIIHFFLMQEDRCGLIASAP